MSFIKGVEQIANKKVFYENALKYWDRVPPTLDGVMGGLPMLSDLDLQESKPFLKKLGMKHGMKTERACDFGAGIGRVADKLLLPVFKEVEMVEFSAKLCEQANKDFTAKGLIERLKITCLPMQDYDTSIKFDLFWFQWCVGHLTDEDFIALFTRLRGKLSENGVIVIKDNCASTEETEFDKDDSSVSRPVTELERLVNEAGLKVIEKEQQKNFPAIGLYPVYTLALRPME